MMSILFFLIWPALKSPQSFYPLFEFLIIIRSRMVRKKVTQTTSRNCDFELKNGFGFCLQGFIAGGRYEHTTLLSPISCRLTRMLLVLAPKVSDVERAHNWTSKLASEAKDISITNSFTSPDYNQTYDLLVLLFLRFVTLFSFLNYSYFTVFLISHFALEFKVFY